MMKLQHLVLVIVASILLDSCVALKPKRPSLPAEGAKVVKKESVINVPVKVDINPIEQYLNDKVPQMVFTQSGLDIGHGAKLTISILRDGRISFGTKNGAIMASVPIYVKGKVDWSDEVKVKPDFGLFNMSSKSIKMSKSQDFEARLTVSAVSKLSIDANWNIKSQTSADFVLTQPPVVTVMGIKISLGNITREKLREQLPRINKLIDEKVSGAYNLHNEMTKYWETIKKPIAFTDKPAKIWGIFEPTAFNFSPPQSVDSKNIQLNLSLRTFIEPYVGENPPQPQTGSLPPLRNKASVDDNFEMNFPVAVEMAELKKIADQQIVGKTFDIPKSSRKVTINSVDVYGSGNQVVIKCNIKSKRTVGDIYLMATPKYDRDTRTVYAENLDFDLNTSNLLANKASWLVNKLFLKTIQEKVKYSVGKNIDDAKVQLQDALDKFKIDDRVKLVAKIQEIHIDDINVGQDVIYLSAGLTGNLSVSINAQIK
jgi:hypothetical protein